MEVWKDTQCHTCIVTMILLLTVSLLPALVEAVATLHYNATSGCPGDDLVFTCLASDTMVLRWTVNTQRIGFTSNRNYSDQQPQSMNQGEIPFRSNSNVRDNGSLTINGADIVAHLTKKRCRSNISCSMKSQLVISIRSNMGNLTVSCESTHYNESETINVKNEDQCVSGTNIPRDGPTSHTANITTEGPPDPGTSRAANITTEGPPDPRTTKSGVRALSPALLGVILTAVLVTLMISCKTSLF